MIDFQLPRSYEDFGAVLLLSCSSGAASLEGIVYRASSEELTSYNLPVHLYLTIRMMLSVSTTIE